jgi:hypothetical protein
MNNAIVISLLNVIRNLFGYSIPDYFEKPIF